ncbi:MAG: DUF6455 family protein [Alphaproteobacteria bacterium]|nr:DUF6455 family protein [Alphaproteobacteria bacterium]
MRFSSILARISRHADLFEAMANKLGVRDKIFELNNAPSVYRRANMRCLSCGQAEACSAWLEAGAEADEAPDYCRNKTLFARLERLSNTRVGTDCHGSVQQSG